MEMNRSARLFIGDGGAFFQGDEGVIAARHDDLATGVLFQKFLQLQPHIQDNLFLFQSGGSDGSRVVAAVPGINDDPADFQAERARQGARAGLGGGSGLDGGSNLRRGGLVSPL